MKTVAQEMSELQLQLYKTSVSIRVIDLDLASIQKVKRKDVLLCETIRFRGFGSFTGEMNISWRFIWHQQSKGTWFRALLILSTFVDFNTGTSSLLGLPNPYKAILSFWLLFLWVILPTMCIFWLLRMNFRRLFMLSAWRKHGSLAIHWARSKDSAQTGRMPRLIWVFAGRTVTLLVLSCRGSFTKLVFVCPNTRKVDIKCCSLSRD